MVINNAVKWSDNTAELKANLLGGIEVTDAFKRSIDRTTASLGGDGLFKAATRLTAGILDLGGATKLTAAEQEKHTATLDKAIEKYEAMGRVAPKAMTDLADAMRAPIDKATELAKHLDELKPSTDNAAAAFTSLKGTLTEVFENPLGAVQKLGGALATDLSTGLGAVGVAAGLAGAALAIVAVGAFELAERAAKVGGELENLHLKTGMSVEGLSKLSYAAQVAGGSVDQIAGAMYNFERQAGNDAPKVAKGMELIGLNLDAIKKMAPEDQFTAIATALAHTEDATIRNAAGNDIFGKSFRDLAPLVMKLNEGLEMTKDLNPWTEKEAKQAEEFEMHLANIRVHFDAIGTNLGREVLPGVDRFVGALSEMTTWEPSQWMKLLLTWSPITGPIAGKGLIPLADSEGPAAPIAKVAGHSVLLPAAPKAPYSQFTLPSVDDESRIVGTSEEEMFKILDKLQEEQEKKAAAAAEKMKTATEAALAATTQLWDEYAQVTAKAAGDSLGAQLLGVTKWYDAQYAAIAKSKATEQAKADWSLALNSDYYVKLQAVTQTALAKIENNTKPVNFLALTQDGAVQMKASQAGFETQDKTLTANRDLAAKTTAIWDDYYKAIATADHDSLAAKLADDAKWYDTQYALIVKSTADEATKYDALIALDTAYYGKLQASATQQDTVNEGLAAKTLGFWQDYYKQIATADGDSLTAKLANEARWYDAQYALIQKSKADEATKNDALIALDTDYYGRLQALRANALTQGLDGIVKSLNSIASASQGAFGTVVHDISLALTAAQAFNKALALTMQGRGGSSPDDPGSNVAGAGAGLGLATGGAAAATAAGISTSSAAAATASAITIVGAWVAVGIAVYSFVAALREANKEAEKLQLVATAAFQAATAFQSATQFSNALSQQLSDTAADFAHITALNTKYGDSLKDLQALAIQAGLAVVTKSGIRDLAGNLLTVDSAMKLLGLDSSVTMASLSEAAHLSDIIKELGGASALTADQIKDVQHSAQELFILIGLGGPIGAAAIKTLDDTLIQFAQNLDSNGRVSQWFTDMVAQARAAGIILPQVAAFFTAQAAQAATGLSDLLTQPLITNAAVIGKAVTDAQKALDDLKASGTATASALATAQDVLTAALTTQHTESERNKQALADLGEVALTTFNTGIASGQSFTQALKAISPQIATIAKAFKDLNIPILDAGLKGLILENEILYGTADKPSSLGTAIGGNQQGTAAAMNFGPGVETAAAFEAQQGTTASLYAQTQAATAAAGGTTINALLPFQQTLHTLDDWAKAHKIELDANTQQMIDQSRELGIWTDEQKTDGELSRQSTAQLIASNNRLIAALGGVPYVPTTADAAANRAAKADASKAAGQPMASGGFGFASGPMTFTTQGNEQYAFSGEGQQFGASALGFLRGDEMGPHGMPVSMDPWPWGGDGLNTGDGLVGPGPLMPPSIWTSAGRAGITDPGQGPNKGVTSTGDTYTITMQVNAVDAHSFQQLLDRNAPAVAGAVIKAVQFNKGSSKTKMRAVLA